MKTNKKQCKTFGKVRPIKDQSSLKKKKRARQETDEKEKER